MLHILPPSSGSFAPIVGRAGSNNWTRTQNEILGKIERQVDLVFDTFSR